MSHRFIATAALAFCIVTLGARADDPSTGSVEERLRRLEEGFEQLGKVNELLRAENQSLRRQLDLAATEVKQPAVNPAGKSEKLQFGGFLQLQGEAGDSAAGRFPDDNDRVYVRRARLSAAGSFAEEVDYRLEGEFAGTLGNSSGMRAQLTDGYVTFRRWPSATIRTGQFKTPFGFEQLFSDTKLATPERSAVNDLLTPGRQLGVQLAGDLSGKRYSYAIGAFNGNASNTSFNDDDNFMVAGRFASLLADDANARASLRAGINAYVSDDRSVTLPASLGFDSTPATPARDNAFNGSRTGFGIDTQLVAGRAELWAEYLATEFEPSNGVPASDVTARGWYAQAGYFAIPGRLQVVGKYEWTDPSDEIDGDDSDLFWFGASWFMKSHDLKLQLFYTIGDAEGYDDSGRVVARVQTMF